MRRDMQIRVSSYESIDDLKQTCAQLKHNDMPKYLELINFLSTIDPGGSSATKKPCHPATMGLGGFAIAVIVLQLHNLGYVGPGLPMWFALFFGGVMQFIAGLKLYEHGETFGFLTFCAYGALWLSVGCNLFCATLRYYVVPSSDIGLVFVIMTVFTLFFIYPAAYINLAVFILYVTLFIGFVTDDIGRLSNSSAMESLACLIFIVAGLIALYVAVHDVYLDVLKVDLLPVGKPLLRLKEKVEKISTNSEVETGLHHTS